MNAKVNELLEKSLPEYAEKLTKWIRVPSVKAEKAEGAPFGMEVRRMLDMAEEDARAMGFAVRSFDGYACDVTLGGEDKEKVAVLGHLDVVPAGDGWQVDPFGAVRVGDRIYGRGTSDDKGPVLAALFAMRAIRDAGVPLKRSIRLILGCDEESGWEDMDYYARHAEMPEMGFSPDASFPLINTEKGMLNAVLRAPLSNEGLRVKTLYTGERINVIPGESVAVVEGNAETLARVEAFARESGMDVTARLVEEGVEITAHGIPGHSAYPEECRNAIGMMLLTLKALGVQGALKTLAEAYPMEYNGASLGIACKDAESGALTCNMGILHLENGELTATLDCRCPITADLMALKAAIIAHLPGIEVIQCEIKQPHHVSADSELVRSLLAAYNEETGRKGEAQSTGGGTYAKVLERGVAFGAAFPEDEDLAHQAGEYIDLNQMLLAMKIYANALLRLCAA